MHKFFFCNLPSLAACVILLACVRPGHAAETIWPEPPSRLSLPTPYGTLDIKTSGYIYESRLMLNGIDLQPKIEGLLNITYAFSVSKAKAFVALVSIGRGNNACPISYRWVTIHKGGYKVSPIFGSCSNQIKVSAQGHMFTLATPNEQKPDKTDIYVYDGKNIRRRHP
ncbi:MAG: hypothetical protein EPN46_02305 [Candidimonas sp.]|nr:MAG: hypothetical protein EPN77_06900 [Candidimonas sp.]TAM19518.1 MAG: hypothetical protein EPN62_18215 [Candidimonas sp.]TAM80165.1 MAG: hypothetical protein EPN46_02305 [Candidimonas sp.]